MKVALLLFATLMFSNYAFAACPYGSQGSDKWEEAVATVNLKLSQTLRNGSHIEEIATDGRPLKVDFDEVHGRVQVTVWRTVNGTKYDTLAKRGIAEVCQVSGGVNVVFAGYTLEISPERGGRLAVGTPLTTYHFAGLSGGSTTVAADRGTSH